MLECVINISEGRNALVLDALAQAADRALLDVHTDPNHNRSVFTLGGEGVLQAARELTRTTIELLDLREHSGVHPRLGLVDVVPFVPIGVPIGPAMDLGEALSARQDFAEFAANELGLPCFFYGPERTLPEIRRRAFDDLPPDLGPKQPDPKCGAVCVGARLPLVAYNLVLQEPDLATAKSVAKKLRSPEVRALGLVVGDDVQVSCNLIAPWNFGPAACYDAVQRFARIKSAELVGLFAEELLARIPPGRYAELDVDIDRTIEARLIRAR
jgi:glutamate formiminotransferase